MATLTENKFGTLTTQGRQKRSKKCSDMADILTRQDRRMRFNNSKDPIYYVFDCIENRPIKVLAKEFVKDSVRDVVNFVSMAIL